MLSFLQSKKKTSYKNSIHIIQLFLKDWFIVKKSRNENALYIEMEFQIGISNMCSYFVHTQSNPRLWCFLNMSTYVCLLITYQYLLNLWIVRFLVINITTQ